MLAYLKSRAEWFTLLGVITVGTSAVCTYFLPGRLWRSTALAQEPQPIALRELAGRGLDENPHVLVTEFECGDKFVSEISYRKDGPLPKPGEFGHRKAWIPLFPKAPGRGADANMATSFKFLLETSPSMASADVLHFQSRRAPLEGLVMPLSRKGLKRDVRDKLREMYPNTDFEKCLLVEEYSKHEREDAPTFAAVLAIGAIGGGVIGVPALTFGIIVGRAKRKQILAAIAAERQAPEKS